MKNAHSSETEMSAPVGGVPIIGHFPERVNTVTAEVLMRLLNRERLTGLDAVFDANTTRLSAVIYSLRNTHGWSIETEDLTVWTKDGRVQDVTEYTLPKGVIPLAMAAGAGDWMAQVRVERRKRRAQAVSSKRIANERNLARHYRKAAFAQLHGQQGLF